MEEQDAVIARLGLKTGEDAVNYLTAATKTTSVKFIHLVQAEPGLEFQPYSLQVVPAAVAVGKGDYYTMSKTGLVHCVLQKGQNATECVSMREWVRQSMLFSLVRSIGYFHHFLHRKMFMQWRCNVRAKLYAEQRKRIETKLLLAREAFCGTMLQIVGEVSALRKAVLVVTPKARIQSDPLEAFLEQQRATRKEAVAHCEATMKRAAEAAAATIAHVLALGEEKMESDDPQQRLEALVAAKLDNGEQNAKTQSMKAAVEDRRARRRLALRAAEDRAMLSDFVRLVDLVMVEVVVEHVLASFEDQLLADFTDPQHKIGLFEVALGLDDTGAVTFEPSLDDFYAMAQQIADDVVGLVARIPRVVDARGCAEHCVSAPYASKFEHLVRSLPRYAVFADKLRKKFADDFDVSRVHNEPTAQVVRPICEASRAFSSDKSQQDHGDKVSYAEARADFEQLVAWGKDLDKLRTRDSVGTIEVTSRLLKQSLSAFVTAKLDKLKAIIRDKAHVQCADVLRTLTQRVEVLKAAPSGLAEYASYVEATAGYDEREMRKLRGPVDQMYTLLQAHDVKIPPDNLVALDEMHSCAAQYSEQLAKAKALKDRELSSHSEQLDKDIVALNTDLVQFADDLATGPFVDAANFDVPGQPVVRCELDKKAEQLKRYTDLAQTYAGYKELFGYSADESPQLKRTTDQFKLVEKLWSVVAQWHDAQDEWMLGNITRLEATDVERLMQIFVADSFSLHKKLRSDVTERLSRAVDDFKPLMPLVADLGNPAMLPRHWEKLCRALGMTFDPSSQQERPLTLAFMIANGIRDHADFVAETSAAASGEHQLEKSLDKMAAAWAQLKFSTKPWRGGSYILVGMDEIQQELDDQIVKTQAMRGSRFVKPFFERVVDWEHMLTTLQDIIDNWLLVQAAWLYLEPIFTSGDISRQIPAESRMFKVVNEVWKDSMASTVADPAVLSVARRDGLVDRLKDANEKLEIINKGLADYLETKRLAFPRFFFLSNDELLSILAETKDPLLVQPHLRKAFDGIANLEFTDRHDILAAYDGPIGKSERLEFAYDACQHKKINPRDSAGNIEKWLGEVEAIMKKSLAHAIDESLHDFATCARGEWLKKWQGQTILTVNQITWVAAVESAIERGGVALTDLHTTRRDELLDVVQIVRGDIPKSLRKTLGSLVVMDVHNRDVTLELSKADLQAATDFDWQAHLRYYVKDLKKSQTSALTGEPGSIDCRMINASILYVESCVAKSPESSLAHSFLTA